MTGSVKFVGWTALVTSIIICSNAPFSGNREESISLEAFHVFRKLSILKKSRTAKIYLYYLNLASSVKIFLLPLKWYTAMLNSYIYWTIFSHHLVSEPVRSSWYNWDKTLTFSLCLLIRGLAWPWTAVGLLPQLVVAGSDHLVQSFLKW